MRYAILMICAISSCTPSTPVSVTTEKPVPNIKLTQPHPESLVYQSPPPLPEQPNLPLAYHHTSRSGVIMSLVSFDDRTFQLRVADQPNGIGTRWRNAQSAAATYRGLAAINGGFFTPTGNPLGLLIETGTKRGAINRSSLGAGMFVSSPTNSAIIRRQHYQTSSTAARAYNLLQSGPMLAAHGQTINGLSKTKPRPRSFIAWDGKNHWAIGYAEPCTLDALSQALAGTSPAGFNINTALNLDGGSSANLWVGPDALNGHQTHRPFFHKAVRNYLVLIPR